MARSIYRLRQSTWGPEGCHFLFRNHRMKHQGAKKRKNPAVLHPIAGCATHRLRHLPVEFTGVKIFAHSHNACVNPCCIEKTLLIDFLVGRGVASNCWKPRKIYWWFGFFQSVSYRIYRFENTFWKFRWGCLMAVIANKQCDSYKAINTIWLLPTFRIRIRRCKLGPGSRLRMGSLNLFGLICVAILNYHNYPDLPSSNIVACRTWRDSGLLKRKIAGLAWLFVRSLSRGW